MENKGLQETFELLRALAALAIAAKKVSEDGKVDLKDLPVLISEFRKGDMYIQAFKGVEQIPQEIKDLSFDEAKQLLDEVLKLVAQVKAA